MGGEEAHKLLLEGDIEDYGENLDDSQSLNQSSTSHRGGPDIIDSMKPAFFFNVRHN